MSDTIDLLLEPNSPWRDHVSVAEKKFLGEVAAD